jgi:hypothetical protein
MTAWLNSPGHRRNIENKNYDEIGLGLGQTDEGANDYWCQVFGRSDDEAGANAPSCRAVVGAGENVGGRNYGGQSCVVVTIVGSALMAVWSLL